MVANGREDDVAVALEARVGELEREGVSRDSHQDDVAIGFDAVVGELKGAPILIFLE